MKAVKLVVRTALWGAAIIFTAASCFAQTASALGEQPAKITEQEAYEIGMEAYVNISTRSSRWT